MAQRIITQPQEALPNTHRAVHTLNAHAVGIKAKHRVLYWSTAPWTQQFTHGNNPVCCACGDWPSQSAQPRALLCLPLHNVQEKWHARQSSGWLSQGAATRCNAIIAYDMQTPHPTLGPRWQFPTGLPQLIALVHRPAWQCHWWHQKTCMYTKVGMCPAGLLDILN